MSEESKVILNSVMVKVTDEKPEPEEIVDIEIYEEV